jgi:hypothetical protein
MGGKQRSHGFVTTVNLPGLFGLFRAASELGTGGCTPIILATQEAEIRRSMV